MHKETEQSMVRLCEMLKTAEQALDSMISSGCLMNIDPKDIPELSDVVKDLAETKKNLWKAAYYESVVKAMEEGESEDGPFGYNNRRYANGEYAPKGRGHISGMTPNERMPRMYMHMQDEEEWPIMGNDSFSMGYSSNGSSGGRSGGSSGSRGSNSGGSGRGGSYGGGQSSGSGGSSSGSGQGENSGGSGSYGYNDGESESWHSYDMARRHYTESRKEADKAEMDARGLKHIHKSMDHIRDIWEEADPTLKKQLKSEMTEFVSDMKV